jgi:excisionase family DNA binding protein
MSSQIFLNGITIEELANALKPLLQPQKTQNQTIQEENELLTREEVCKLLSINKTTLWKHTKSGKLKSLGLGNRVYYKKSEVLQAVKHLNQ